MPVHIFRRIQMTRHDRGVRKIGVVLTVVEIFGHQGDIALPVVAAFHCRIGACRVTADIVGDIALPIAPHDAVAHIGVAVGAAAVCCGDVADNGGVVHKAAVVVINAAAISRRIVGH